VEYSALDVESLPFTFNIVQGNNYSTIKKTIINQLKYITFLFYNTKISDNNAESGKLPRMLAAFPR
jgi:hypothetical protein